MQKIQDCFSPLFLALCVFFAPSAGAFSAQEIDPFYLQLFERAQKSFLAKNYEQAASDFEIAAFGLLGTKTLRAKAYVYISLSRFYLKDMGQSEKYLREAADLTGDDGIDSLDIDKSARPDLDKLMAFFNIQQAQPSQRADAPLPQKEETSKKPDEQAAATEAMRQSPPAKEKAPDAPAVAPAKPEEKGAEPSPSRDSGKSAQITLDNLKEGDLLPLDMVETQPVVLKRVAADYPSAAKSFRIEGTVIVNALVSEKGDVIKTEIVTGIKGAFGFNQLAQMAVRKWRFEPATIKGIKVKVWMPIAITFKTREPA
jgi:TonB family protein